MPTTLVLPDGYNYVLAVAVSSAWLNAWQFMKVGGARKAAKIPYPRPYAEKDEAAASKEAYVFNCVQRAHQNTLEGLPHFLTAMFIGGLSHPKVAAGLGATWILGRILYTIGYSSGDPKKRNSGGGFLNLVGLLGLMGTSTYTVVNFLRGDLGF